jgi:phage tail-like protein
MTTAPTAASSAFFKVEIQDAVIGRFAECNGLAFEWVLTAYHEGGLNTFEHRFRDRITYPNLVLVRGVTDDQALAKWCLESKAPETRGHVIISVLGRDSKPLRKWAFARAFPIKWNGPRLTARGELALETLEIAHEGLLPT